MRAFFAALAVVAVQATDSKFEILEGKQMPSNGNTPITIIENGQSVTKYIASDYCTSSGADYNCSEGNRGFIINDPYFDTSNPNFYKPNLLGGSVEWDTDMSAHECGCLSTFYTISVPARHEDGSLWNTDKYFYCDANQSNGSWCPEMDLMEANKYSFATTSHRCDAPNDKGFYQSCDRSGIAENVVEQLAWNGYGPGSQYTIDTTQPFHVKVNLAKDGGNNLSSVETVLSQNGKTQTMTGRDSGYLSKMSADVANGMAFIVSNWQGDDSWLRKDRCSGQCYGNPMETISNLTIVTDSGKPVDPPVGPYDPKDFTFGDSCAHATDEICGQVGCPSVDHCRWSWSNGTSSGDLNAHCRCDILTM